MAKLGQTLGIARWHCEPPFWSLTDERLTVSTGLNTDFWQDTYYGFRRDDGHFLGKPVSGDFSAIVVFEADYEELYDQAGLMMRADTENWLKAGVEYSDDTTNFSTVVTRNGRSDWSVVAVPRISGKQSVRLTRIAGAVITHFLSGDGNWHLMRLADFPDDRPVGFGPFACSPQREGLEARFFAVNIGPAIKNPLHAS